VPADAVVIAVAKASGDDGTGPVVFEFEVIGNYTADK
jgi:hypothetical protein